MPTTLESVVTKYLRSGSSAQRTREEYGDGRIWVGTSLGLVEVTILSDDQSAEKAAAE
jgi:hypothetical protein